MEHWEIFIENAAAFLPKLLLAAAVFAVGYILIRFILRLCRKAFTRSKHIDPTIYPFILTLLKIVLLVLLTLTCLGISSLSL